MSVIPRPFSPDASAAAPGRPLRVLVTGFQPFGGSPVNPSAELVARLADQGAPGCEVRAMVLPVVGGTAAGSARAMLDVALDALRPDAVVMFGEAHVRGEISIERVAVNLRDYSIPDNVGGLAHDEPVVPGAPDALFTALPVRHMMEAALMAGVPCGLSMTAGTFLCNEVMFHVLERRARTGEPAFAGFVHVPQLPVQAVERPVGAAAMPLPVMERGARSALAGLAAERTRQAERRLELT
jgi:pyroglutamyl-peptidase